MTMNYQHNHLEWFIVQCRYSIRFSVTQQIILHLTGVHSVMPTINLTLTHSTVTFDLLYRDGQRTVQKLNKTEKQKHNDYSERNGEVKEFLWIYNNGS